MKLTLVNIAELASSAAGIVIDHHVRMNGGHDDGIGSIDKKPSDLLFNPPFPRAHPPTPKQTPPVEATVKVTNAVKVDKLNDPFNLQLEKIERGSDPFNLFADLPRKENAAPTHKLPAKEFNKETPAPTRQTPSEPKPTRKESPKPANHEPPQRRGVEIRFGRGESYRPEPRDDKDRERDRMDIPRGPAGKSRPRSLSPPRERTPPPRRDRSPARRRSPPPRASGGRSLTPPRERSPIRRNLTPPPRRERTPPASSSRRERSPHGRSPPRSEENSYSSRWNKTSEESDRARDRRQGSRERRQLTDRKRDPPPKANPEPNPKPVQQAKPDPPKSSPATARPAVGPSRVPTGPATGSRNSAVDKLTAGLSLSAKLEARLAIEGTVKLTFKGPQPSLPSVINSLHLPNLLRLEFRNAALYLRLLDAPTACVLASSYKNKIRSEEARKILDRVKLSHPADYFPPIKSDTMEMYRNGVRRRMVTTSLTACSEQAKTEFLDAAKKQWGFFAVDGFLDGRIILEYDGIETSFLARKQLTNIFQKVELNFIEERGTMGNY